MASPLFALTDLRVDGLCDPLGIAARAPRLSWRIDSSRRGLRQRAFRIRVDGDAAWDSGRVEDPCSIGVPYGGPEPLARGRYRWQVKAWDDAGEESGWSVPGSWEMGLRAPADWRARWIRAPEPDTVPDIDGVLGAPAPAPLLRTGLRLDAEPVRARAYASALGLYELRINGTRVGRQVLAPGWTDYRKRIEYQTYDVTSLLHAGDNTVGAVLGNGWYSGHVAFFDRHVYGDAPALLLQLEVETDAGEVVTLVTDERWRTACSGILADDLLMGERVDASAWPIGWDRPGFDDSRWTPARRQAPPGGALVAQVDRGTAVVATVEPVAFTRYGDRWIADLGQNLVGRVRLVLEEPAGTVVRLRHGEALDADRALYTANLRTADPVDSFVTAGGGDEVFEPRFTFHGFRYAEVAGVTGSEPPRLAARVLSADLEPAGEFSCSDPMLNQLQQNIVWSQRGNFLSVPTDCPQRDERLGWTGDAQVFTPTAAWNMDVMPFFRKWLADLDDAQLPSGAYPDIAPAPFWSGAGNSGWGDAGVLIPWSLYVRYGAGDLLERHYAGMCRYLAFLEADSTGLVRSAGRYGDWLSLEGPTPKDVVGTAYFARVAGVLARIAAVLGDEEGRARYAELRAAIGEVFASRFLGEDGAVARGTQTGQILALHAGLVPLELRAAAARALADSIEARGGHLATGFLGTPLALPVLSEHGHHELACRVAQSDTYPSWGFQVKHGATTTWERWDGWTPERGFADERMNSFNHYAFGSIGDWLYRYVGGLDPDPEHPGLGHATVRPRPGGTLRSARLGYESVHGRWEVAWELGDDGLSLDLLVPANATADVVLPGRDVEAVGSGRHPFLTALPS